MQLLATQLRNTNILITLAAAPKDVQAFPITLAPPTAPLSPGPSIRSADRGFGLMPLYTSRYLAAM